MKSKVILIPEKFIKNVEALFKKHRIEFTIAGSLNEDVTVYQQFVADFNSIKPEKADLVIEKIEPPKKAIVNKQKLEIRKPEKPKTNSVKPKSEHIQMRDFAKSLDCKDIGSAIQKVGSASRFRARFKKEYIPA